MSEPYFGDDPRLPGPDTEQVDTSAFEAAREASASQIAALQQQAANFMETGAGDVGAYYSESE